MSMPTRPILHRNSSALLQRLLEEPALDQLVRQLRGPEWKALIRHVGLEDASELLALSTAEQLVELVDESLWISGTDTFDLEGFATLLEVLHESGTGQLADKVAALPEEFLLLALSKLVSVWPTDFLQQLAETDESGVLDKRLESQMFEEFDEYCVLSPSGLAWDALFALFNAWSDVQPELLNRLLGRLSAANVSSVAEPDELVTVLDELAEFEEDAQAEREQRRARSGYVSASDARAFLRLPPSVQPGETDAISAAYFRRLQPEPVATQQLTDHRLLERLRAHSRPLGSDAKRKLNTGAGLLKRALEQLAQRSPRRHTRALEELAFLTNVVLATLDTTQDDAGSLSAEAVRSVVIAVEAAGVGEVGLDLETSTDRLCAALNEHGPIALFRKRPR